MAQDTDVNKVHTIIHEVDIKNFIFILKCTDTRLNCIN